MAPLFLLTVAFSVVFVVVLFVVARQLDRRVKAMIPDDTVEALQTRLETALAEQARLRQRVENLEAIVTAEAWDALHEESHDNLSDEERAARLARRPRTR